jgi:hypothetical protein
LFWDSATNRLGIGTNAPSYALHVNRNVNGGEYLYITNSNTGTGAVAGVFINTNAGALTTQAFGSGFTPDPINNIYPSSVRFRSSLGITNGLYFVTAGTAPLYFASGDVPRLQVNGSTGNVLIQNGGTFTDGGQRLQVQGTTLLNGNVTFSSATGMFWDATNSRLGIGTNAPTYKLHVVDSSSTAGGQIRGLVVENGSTFNNLTFGIATTTGKGNANAGFLVDGAIKSAFAWDRTRQFIGFNNWDYSSNDFALRLNSNGSLTFHNGITFGSAALVSFLVNNNVLIGSTSDSGERLQVTGTMKVTGQVTSINAYPTVRAYSTSASENAGFLAQTNNGSGNNLQFIAFGSSASFGFASNSGLGSSSSIILYGNNSTASGGTTVIKLRPGGYDVGADALVAYQNSVSIGTTNNPVASAVLDVVSTTKGFLPPRMTTTQKNAISSPAVGLIVYCTDMVEGLYVYKSGGWTFVI